jgi:hypothetical protein
VNLSTFLSNGQAFEIVKAKDAFGAPVRSGTYHGPVSVPLQQQEFDVYLVRRQ